MKVLLLTPIFPPDRGGAALAFHYLSRIFAANANVTDILVLSNWRGARKLFRTKGKIKHLKILKYGTHKDPVFTLLWNTLVIQEVIRQYQPRVIIFHSVILPFREYYRELFRDIGGIKLYLYKTDLFPVPDFPQLTGIVYLAENIGRMLRQQKVPDEKLIHIPLLFKPPRPGNYPIPFKFKYLLFIGSTDPLKGFYQLQKAFEILTEKYKHLKLVVIGPDTGGASYHPGILFLNELNRRQVTAHIKGAAAVVIPSFSEGLPRVALETLYLNRPLIITGIVAETRHLGPNQVLDTNEPEEIARKTEKILDGESFNAHFPWEQLDFKRAKASWNCLVEKIETTGNIPSIDAGFVDYASLARELVERQYRAAQEYFDSVRAARRFQDIPAEVTNRFPGLDRILHFRLLKIPDIRNEDSYIEGVVKNPYLVNREKKELLKSLLLRLFEEFGAAVEAGKLKKLFSCLVPLTAHDYIFLGDYCLKQKRMTDAVSFFYQGLEHGPESLHLNIYARLIRDGRFSFTPAKREELEQRRGRHLRTACRFLSEKKNKTDLEIYHLASMQQQLKAFEKAAGGFERILKGRYKKELKTGACFHLGEIAYCQQRYSEALLYFKKTCQWNPAHQKAAQYLESLEEMLN